MVDSKFVIYIPSIGPDFVEEDIRRIIGEFGVISRVEFNALKPPNTHFKNARVYFKSWHTNELTERIQSTILADGKIKYNVSDEDDQYWILMKNREVFFADCESFIPRSPPQPKSLQEFPPLKPASAAAVTAAPPPTAAKEEIVRQALRMEFLNRPKEPDQEVMRLNNECDRLADENARLKDEVVRQLDEIKELSCYKRSAKKLQYEKDFLTAELATATSCLGTANAEIGYLRRLIEENFDA